MPMQVNLKSISHLYTKDQPPGRSPTLLPYQIKATFTYRQTNAHANYNTRGSKAPYLTTAYAGFHSEVQ